jgi:hypothetical protein
LAVRIAVGLLAMVVLLAAGSAILGVPVAGTYLGRDADFAIMAVQMLSASWASGDLWPRWLMDATFGLGGTTFYSYPPLAYWAAAATMAVTDLSAPTSLGLAIAAWRMLAVVTGYLWLRRHVSPATALSAAVLGALLPHASLVNPWMRFAYSETAAIALLPLLLLALERLAEGRQAKGIPAVALAYAALALTNLPICTLAAHLGPLYAWAYGGRLAALRSLIGGAAGAALAAAFLLPAFGLLRHSNAAELFNPSWRDNLLVFTTPNGWLALIWGSMLLAFGLGLWLLRAAAPGAGRSWRTTPGLLRALATLLLAAFALATVLTLPLWLTMPQLTAVEHPWRTTAFLSPAVSGLTALALSARLRHGRPGHGMLPRGALLTIALTLALLPPAFLAGLVAFGNPDWPRFLPAEQRLAFTRVYSGAYSGEHIPAEAAAAGWEAVIAGEPEPFLRPVPPPGTQRLQDGFLVPEANGPFTLPQFFFPAWSAQDALGPMPLRASPEGFLEVAVDRPVRDLQVRIYPTVWERTGWAISFATATALMLLLVTKRLVLRRRATAVLAAEQRGAGGGSPSAEHHGPVTNATPV